MNVLARTSSVMRPEGSEGPVDHNHFPPWPVDLKAWTAFSDLYEELDENRQSVATESEFWPGRHTKNETSQNQHNPQVAFESPCQISASQIDTSNTSSYASQRLREKGKQITQSGKNEDFKYKCRFCGKNFPKSQALGGHMNCHRYEREHEQLILACELVERQEQHHPNLIQNRGSPLPYVNSQGRNQDTMIGMSYERNSWNSVRSVGMPINSIPKQVGGKYIPKQFRGSTSAPTDSFNPKFQAPSIYPLQSDFSHQRSKETQQFNLPSPIPKEMQLPSVNSSMPIDSPKASGMSLDIQSLPWPNTQDKSTSTMDYMKNELDFDFSLVPDTMTMEGLYSNFQGTGLGELNMEGEHFTDIESEYIRKMIKANP